MGMGIGDWAQSPIPNPQSPIPIFPNNLKYMLKKYYINNNFFNKLYNVYSNIRLIIIL